MKKIVYWGFLLILGSCMTTREIGSINMISNRNIESSANYVLLKSYMGSGRHDLKDSDAQTIQDAVDRVVKSTPGGEFLKNVKIYEVTRKGLFETTSHISAEGDVWGLKENSNFQGFKVGDRVQWTKLFKQYTGTIVDLKDNKSCTIKRDQDSSIVTVEYRELMKVGNN